MTGDNAGSGRSDSELVSATLGGDHSAFGRLIERYRIAFARYATSVCGDSDLAADAMQETFIRVHRSLASCRNPARFKAWFFRILTNQCHNVRDRTRQHARFDEVDQLASDHSADRRLDVAELRAAMNDALAALTAEQRDAFVLRHVQGCSYDEMAAILDEGVDALKMRVYRARDTVKGRLERWL